MPLDQDLVAGRKAVEEGKPAEFEATSDIIDHRGIVPGRPPEILLFPGGLAEPGPDAAVVLMDPRLALAAPVVFRDLGDVDAQIDREQAVPVFPEPGDVDCAGRVRCAHLNADDLGEAILGATIECPPSDFEAGAFQKRAKRALDIVDR